jgi:hypothetical protein
MQQAESSQSTATREDLAVELMLDFARRTGLTEAGADRRYLWTDAFAVCTLLGLSNAVSRPSLRNLAVSLVDRVHRSLGRHRSGDSREGWLSGLPDADAEQHPTIGGLRIGKPMPERSVEDPYDPRAEWDRDGQYFHYLTKWMHALSRVAAETGRTQYDAWAAELCSVAHGAFTYAPIRATQRRMHWKMSVDLSRPLVASMGQHDPLDGWLTALELFTRTPTAELRSDADDYRSMVDPGSLATDDPLGLGGLMIDLRRAERLRRGGFIEDRSPIVGAIAIAIDRGLAHFVSRWDPAAPASRRLAFRELGLSIGLRAIARGMSIPLGVAIESFWLRPENQRASSWAEHLDINTVMLATSLAPEGFLGRE